MQISSQTPPNEFSDRWDTDAQSSNAVFKTRYDLLGRRYDPNAKEAVGEYLNITDRTQQIPFSILLYIHRDSKTAYFAL